MIDCKYIIEQVQQDYEILKNKAREQEISNEQLLYQNEEYKTISYEINSLIFDLQKAEFLNETEKISKLNEKLKDLKEKQEKVKSAYNLPDFKSTFLCAKCKDTGYTEKGICHCYYNHLTRECYEFLQVKIPKLVSFSDDTISSESENKAIFDKLKIYAEKFNIDSKSLLLLGQTGTGKTFISQAIAKHVSKKNFNVLYLTACEYSQILLKYHMASFYEKNIYYEILTTADLLVIDDLGTEPIYRNVTLEYTHAILSNRITLNKPFIITTNLNLKNLLNRYGERLFSRMTAKNVFKIEFKGKSLR